MIEPIANLPGNVLGFTARGRVTGSDYESTIIPAVEEAFKHERKIRFLYHFPRIGSGNGHAHPRQPGGEKAGRVTGCHSIH